jgi:hypothetical protein
MYLNRILLLVLVLLYVFAPTMADWVAAGGTQWYRPHLIWAARDRRYPASRCLPGARTMTT